MNPRSRHRNPAPRFRHYAQRRQGSGRCASTITLRAANPAWSGDKRPRPAGRTSRSPWRHRGPRPGSGSYHAARTKPLRCPASRPRRDPPADPGSPGRHDADGPAPGTTSTASARPAGPPRRGSACGGPRPGTGPAHHGLPEPSRRSSASRPFRAAPDHTPPRCQYRGRRCGQRARVLRPARRHRHQRPQVVQHPQPWRGHRLRRRAPSRHHADWRTVWYSGGKLAPDLTLPKPRHRWAPSSTTARDQFTAAERNAIWEHAAQAARCATGGPGRQSARTPLSPCSTSC